MLKAVADGLDVLVAFATIRIHDKERNTERKIETEVGINSRLRRQYSGTLNCAIRHVGTVPNLIGKRLIRGCQSRSLVASTCTSSTFFKWVGIEPSGSFAVELYRIALHHNLLIHHQTFILHARLYP